MDKLILTKKEVLILKECLAEKKETQEALKNIFISGKHIYSTDGKRAVKLTKSDELRYSADGEYKIIGENKIGNVGSELFLEKQDVKYPTEIITIMSGFNFTIFTVTISPDDIKSSLVINLWEKSGRAIDIKYLEILYKICDYDKVEILSQVEEKNSEKPIIMHLSGLNIDYIILPYEFKN